MTTIDHVALNAERITETVSILEKRITDRFPKAGLARICKHLHEVAEQTQARCRQISQPNWLFRGSAICLVALLIGFTLIPFAFVKFQVENLTITDLVQVLEAAINDIVLIGAGVFFISTIETRFKRKKSIGSDSRTAIDCPHHRHAPTDEGPRKDIFTAQSNSEFAEANHDSVFASSLSRLLHRDAFAQWKDRSTLRANIRRPRRNGISKRIGVVGNWTLTKDLAKDHDPPTRHRRSQFRRYRTRKPTQPLIQSFS